MKNGLAIGGLAFALYLFSAGPSIVPYRDASEMATTVPTLGIIHPTSYPAYSLIGALFQHVVPFANPAYRLNVFSALCMAVAWALLFIFLGRFFAPLYAAVAVAFGALSYYFWWHALVSEMYALNILFIAALLLAWAERRFLFFAFLFGVGLANRADLLLTAPAFLLAWRLDPEARAAAGTRQWPAALMALLTGLALYIYLPLRAQQQPWLNWNDPSTIDQWLGSLLRRGYAGGLDLLSLSYQKGENFWPQFVLYAKHLWRDFAYVGLPLALAGAVALYRQHKALAILCLVGWLVTGPGFIWLGNLPPNAHAVAIVEAAYLTPDLFVLVAIAAGLAWIAKRPIAILVVLASVAQAAFIFAHVNKRDNFLAIDFMRNVYHTVPPQSLVVGRKDVPIFSLFYGHWIEPRKTDRIPIAQGLIASPWYQRMMRRQESGLELQALRTTEDWTRLQTLNATRPIFATSDIDWPPEGMRDFAPLGILRQWNAPLRRAASDAYLRELYVYRGTYRYGFYRDFFSNELVEHYAKGWLSLEDGDSARRAWSIQPDFPYAPFQLAYTYYMQGDYATALRYYEETQRRFAAMLALADAWNALPGVKQSIQTDAALVQTHINAVRSKQSGRHQPNP
jgi:hypothetical protein